MTDLEKAREFFGGDLYATSATGIVIEEVGDHFARCLLIKLQLPLQKQLLM